MEPNAQSANKEPTKILASTNTLLAQAAQVLTTFRSKSIDHSMAGMEYLCWTLRQNSTRKNQ